MVNLGCVIVAGGRRDKMGFCGGEIQKCARERGSTLQEHPGVLSDLGLRSGSALGLSQVICQS
jgi:hypothetical protein